MNRMGLMAAVMYASLGSTAMAQLVTPVPPAPAPTPEYNPPAPTPVAPPAPAADRPPPPPPEPEIPAIDLVQRDGSGKMIPPTTPPEELAVEAILGHLTEDSAKESVRKLMEDRRSAAEQMVARHAQVALEARAKIQRLDAISDTRELSGINSDLTPALVRPGLVDMAQQMRVLTPKQVQKARDAIKGLREAISKEIKESSGGDPVKIIEPTVRANVRLNAIEPMRALDGLLDRLVDRWSTVRGGLGLTDAQASAIAAAERTLGSARDARAKRDALAAVLGGLSSQQQSTALLTIAAPMPEGLPEAPPAPATKPRPGVKPKAEDTSK